MPYFEHDGRLVFFAHVPKTGGTSIERYLEARFGPLSLIDPSWEKYWLGGGCRTSTLRASPQHIVAADAARLMPRPPDRSFAVVRDPVTRLVSEFRFQMRAPRRRRTLARLGFSTWLRMVIAAARRDPSVYDNHLRSQSAFVPEDAEIFRMEDGFEPVVEWLDAATGGAAPQVSMGHELKSTPDAPVTLRRPDLELIAMTYADDYARFGYSAPDPSAAPGDAPAPLRRLAGEILAPYAVHAWGAGRL